MDQIGHLGVYTTMENTGNFYDDNRKGDTSETYAPTVTEAQGTEIEISDSHKWASRIFTAVAILGWITIGALILDAMMFNSNLMEWIMIGQ